MNPTHELDILRAMPAGDTEPPAPTPSGRGCAPEREALGECPMPVCGRMGPVDSRGAVVCLDHGTVDRAEHGYCLCGTRRILMYREPGAGLLPGCPECHGMSDED